MKIKNGGAGRAVPTTYPFGLAPKFLRTHLKGGALEELDGLFELEIFRLQVNHFGDGRLLGLVQTPQLLRGGCGGSGVGVGEGGRRVNLRE